MPKKPPPPPKPRKTHKPAPGTLPDEASLLQFIAGSPGAVGKREIARAFGLTGAAKIGLKAMLKDMEGRGLLGRRGNNLQSSATLPPVAMVEVVAIDEDGEAQAQPVEWDEATMGPAPLIQLAAAAASAPGVGDRVLARLQAALPGSAYAYSGKVMRSLTTDAPRIVGIFRSSSSGGRIVPSGKKDRDDYLVPRGDEGGAQDGELVQADVSRHRGRGLPQARVRKRLGSAADPRNTSLIAIHAHGIPDAFPQTVLDEVQRLKPFTHEGREDLRDIPLITIDPADARDHDDAIFAEPDTDPQNPGGFRLLIAIADVAAYVRPGTALDREARKRGNSVYFPDRVVPMLPERISNDLCSLREGQDRPALACAIVIDAHGHKLSHSFSRCVIRVAAGLAYEDAQAAINGGGSSMARNMLAGVLQPLWAAYGALVKARGKRNPLDLDLPERKIILDEAGNIARVVVPDRLDAHRLVEEFMIQANVAAAEELNRKRTPLLFRVHEEPSAEKLRALAEFLRTVNIPFALGQVVRAQHFNRILAQAQNTPHQRVVHEVVLRSQAQANYRPSNAGHFGLSLANYAHFTSPIRRYADLVVHRALIKALKLGQDGLTAEDIANLEETGSLISAAERRAMLAERETLDRLIAIHLKDKLGATFAGRISGVVSAGLFVVLDETGADGFVPASSLGAEYFAFDAPRHALVGTASGETHQLGDAVTVKLVEVAPIRGGMRFELISQGKAGSAPRGASSRGRRGGGPPKARARQRGRRTR